MQKGLVKLVDDGSCSKKNKHSILTFCPHLLQAFQDAVLGARLFEHISGIQLMDQERAAASSVNSVGTLPNGYVRASPLPRLTNI
jgi:hypothetical protein